MSVGWRAEVNARDMQRVSRVLNSVNKELMADLRKNMRGAIKPTADQIAKISNSEGGALSGARRSKGRTRWQPVKGVVAISPGRGKRGWTPLVAMEFYSGAKTKGPAGYFIQEFAGYKNPAGSTASGRAMIATLNVRVPGWGKGGRFVYRAFQPFKREVYHKAKAIMVDWTRRTTRELEKI
jgi:hypothetical protein